MTTTKKTIKKIRPSEIDASFRYRCPECEHDHWLSLREVSYRGFVIVCVCNNILKPKQIIGIKPILNKKTKKRQIPNNNQSNIIKNAYHILDQYGFSKEEIDSVMTQNNIEVSAYTDVVDLVKIILTFFGEQHD